MDFSQRLQLKRAGGPSRTNTGSPTACESGAHYYTCQSNGFGGCCSIDPCDLDDCPQQVTLLKPPKSASKSATSTLTATVTTTIVDTKLKQTGTTTTSLQISIFTSHVPHSVTDATSRPESPNTNLSSENWIASTDTSKSSAPDFGLPTSASVGPISTETPITRPSSSSSSNTSIIAGSIGGILTVAIICFVLWCFLRVRRQRKDKKADSNSSCREGNDRYALERNSNDPAEQDSRPSNIFAGDGGML